MGAEYAPDFRTMERTAVDLVAVNLIASFTVHVWLWHVSLP